MVHTSGKTSRHPASKRPQKDVYGAPEGYDVRFDPGPKKNTNPTIGQIWNFGV
jgi:hypothetical protein